MFSLLYLRFLQQFFSNFFVRCIFLFFYFQDLSELVFRSHKAALLYDGVHLFSRAVEKLISDTDLTTPQVSCDNKDSPYLLGEPLLKEINSVSPPKSLGPRSEKFIVIIIIFHA